MTTADNVLDLARSQLGVCETPMGSNNTIYNSWFYGRPVHGAAYPWCSVFVSWLFAQLNARSLIHIYSAYSGDILNAMRRAGEEVNILDVKPGDIVTYDYGDGGMTDHIGIVEMRIGPRSFWTIEGNTNDCVKRHERTQGSGISMWFTRPKYEKSKPKEEDDMGVYDVHSLHLVTNKDGSPKLDGGQLVYQTAEAIHALTDFEWSRCCLLLAHENDATVNVSIFTLPHSRVTTVKLKSNVKNGGKDARKAICLDGLGLTGGFAVTCKCEVPITAEISLLGKLR